MASAELFTADDSPLDDSSDLAIGKLFDSGESEKVPFGMAERMESPLRLTIAARVSQAQKLNMLECR